MRMLWSMNGGASKTQAKRDNDELDAAMTPEQRAHWAAIEAGELAKAARS